MPKIKFTQERIDTLPLPEAGRVDYYDSGQPKLVCRVSSTGVKSFVLLKWTGTNTVRVTLGRFPDISVAEARKKAIEGLVQLSKGVNPTEQKRIKKARSITLQEIFDQYLANKTDLREASISDYTYKLKQGFSDWLNKPVNEITPNMVLARRRQLSASGGGVDHKLRVLRFLLHYAVRRKVIDVNPVSAITEEKLWTTPTRRKRLIPREKLKVWYEAVLALENEKAKVYLLCLLYTGLRDSDVRYMEWVDVDFDKDCLLARDTKNGTDFTAYISPQLKPHLRALQALTGDGQYLFPGATKDGVMAIPRSPIQQVYQDTGIEFSSHDLKRTFLTIGEAAAVPFSLLKALANHKTGRDVTEGYIIAEAHTLRQATFKIADEIAARLVNDNVVSLKKRVV